jgi:hypothetical protein
MSLLFTYSIRNNNNSIFNKYIPGSFTGSTNVSVRRAKKLKATSCKSCCRQKISGPLGFGEVYPPIAIATDGSFNISNQPYGNGIYNTLGSGSSGPTFRVRRAFDKSISSIHGGNNNRYNSLTGIYTFSTLTNILNSTPIKGEYAELVLPVESKIYLDKFTIYASSSGMPNEFYMLGSNDGNYYNILYYTKTSELSPLSSKTYFTDKKEPYNRFRLVCVSIIPRLGSTRFSVAEIYLYNINQNYDVYSFTLLQ